MKLYLSVVTILSCSAFAVMSHEGVENLAVKARMKSMSEIAANVKTLGGMARGAAQFDCEKARMAIDKIVKNAEKTVALFEESEMDPMSEALPAIWENYDDFTEKALALETAALIAAAGFSGEKDLKSVISSIATTCKSCHSIYRR